MLVPNRHSPDLSRDYRYGFQGQEMDNELKGRGNSLNYTFRMHDTRVGRFFATDPLEKKYPFFTPYQFSANTPIMAVELEGLESSNDPNQTQKPVHGTIDKKNKKVYLTNDDPDPTGTWVPHPSQKKVNQTYDDVVKGINYAIENGSKYAASNMKYWLSGKGGTIPIPSVVKNTSSYKKAFEENMDRFLYEDNSRGKNLYEIAEKLKNGQSTKFSDYWESPVTFDFIGNSEKDLYYAWGTINLKTTGEFLIKKDAKGVITITAKITNEVMDNYNWNPNKSTPLVTGNTVRVVQDNDLLLLEVFKGAKSFKGYNKFVSQGTMRIDSNGSSDGWRFTGGH